MVRKLTALGVLFAFIAWCPLLFAGEAEAAALALAVQTQAAIAPNGNSPAVVAPKAADGATVIAWQRETPAWNSGRPMWIHFTNAGNVCQWCDKEDAMLDDPRVIAASQDFACVILCWCDPSLHKCIEGYGIRWFPTDFFLLRDRKTNLVFEGAPSGGVLELLRRFNAAKEASLIPGVKIECDGDKCRVVPDPIKAFDTVTAARTEPRRILQRGK